MCLKRQQSAAVKWVSPGKHHSSVPLLSKGSLCRAMLG